jgi:hypothetical protein
VCVCVHWLQSLHACTKCNMTVSMDHVLVTVCTGYDRVCVRVCACMCVCMCVCVCALCVKRL